jgi:hypothetical protein
VPTLSEILQPVLRVEAGAGGQQGVCLEPQELPPGRADATGRRAEAASAKHRGDGRGRDVDPELQELASDPQVAPSRVLPAEAKDQVLDRWIERGATGGAGAAPEPCPRELSVPPEEGVGPDQEAPPPVPGEQPGSRGQERSIGPGVARSRPSPTENLELVAEHRGLEITFIEAAAHEQTEQAAEEPVPQGQEHRPSLNSPRAGCEWRGQSPDRVSLPHRLGGLRSARLELPAVAALLNWVPES